MFAFAVVSLRLMGAYLLLMSSISLAPILMTIDQPSVYGESLLSSPVKTAVLVLPALLGLTVILVAKLIAVWIVPKRKSAATEGAPIDQGALIAAGTAVVGVHFAAMGLNSLLTSLILQADAPFTRDFSLAWPAAVQTAIGVALILWARFAPRMLLGKPSDFD